MKEELMESIKILKEKIKIKELIKENYSDVENINTLINSLFIIGNKLKQYYDDLLY